MKTKSEQKNIPDGWHQKELGDVCQINMGQSPSSRAYNKTGDGLPLIQGNNDIKSGITIERIWTNETTRVADKGSIILTVRAPVGVVGVAHDKICIGRGVCSINSSNQRFIFHFLKYYESKWSSLEQGSTFTAVNGPDIRGLKLGLPPLPEQNRIVSVLETWDKAIERLAKKIEFKKNIKKGLMQDLLTGKKRLQGHKDKWETVELGEVFDYEQPTKYLVSSTEYDDSYNTPVLTANKGFILGYTNEIDGVYDTKSPVIIFDDFTTDNKFVDFKFKVKSSAIKILIAKNKKVNIRFLYGKIKLIKFIVGQHKRHYLSECQYITIDIPRIDEQNAIENILTTADNEITQLKKKLSIIKDQKKYLLNNLITGTIRTPETIKIKV